MQRGSECSETAMRRTPPACLRSAFVLALSLRRGHHPAAAIRRTVASASSVRVSALEEKRTPAVPAVRSDAWIVVARGLRTPKLSIIDGQSAGWKASAAGCLQHTGAVCLLAKTPSRPADW